MHIYRFLLFFNLCTRLWYLIVLYFDTKHLHLKIIATASHCCIWKSINLDNSLFCINFSHVCIYCRFNGKYHCQLRQINNALLIITVDVGHTVQCILADNKLEKQKTKSFAFQTIMLNIRAVTRYCTKSIIYAIFGAQRGTFTVTACCGAQLWQLQRF